MADFGSARSATREGYGWAEQGPPEPSAATFTAATPLQVSSCYLPGALHLSLKLQQVPSQLLCQYPPMSGLCHCMPKGALLGCCWDPILTSSSRCACLLIQMSNLITFRHQLLLVGRVLPGRLLAYFPKMDVLACRSCALFSCAMHLLGRQLWHSKSHQRSVLQAQLPFSMLAD